jgi:hypothetical protein
MFPATLPPPTHPHPTHTHPPTRPPTPTHPTPRPPRTAEASAAKTKAAQVAVGGGPASPHEFATALGEASPSDREFAIRALRHKGEGMKLPEIVEWAQEAQHLSARG